MRWALAIGLCVLATGCSTLSRIPHTEADQAAATIPGVGDVRVFGDTPTALLAADSGRRGQALPRQRRAAYLALSGGGGAGAYGAGILNGWTESGTRPEFTVVSGVSAGALMAPFAFLGPEYDGLLRDLYTSGIAETLLESPDLFNAVFGSGLFGNQRLRQLVGQFVDANLLVAIAAEHARGRRLLVVTTNLDAQRAVIWDMGRIASSGSPAALNLFRDVLTASASVPVVFPPMLIDAQANGRLFQEMHADGAVTAPVFTLPEAFLLRSVSLAQAPQADIYVLLNAKIEPDFQVVPDRTVAIARRATSTAVQARTRGIVFDTYRFARRNGIGFNLTYIDKDLPSDTSGFETAAMRRLYQYGYEKARAGGFWERSPPGTETTSVAQR